MGWFPCQTWVDANIDLAVNPVEACPAVTHLRKNGYPVAELFFETTRTVNETICEGTHFAAELLNYNPKTGSGIQRFTRLRPSKKLRRAQ